MKSVSTIFYTHLLYLVFDCFYVYVYHECAGAQQRPEGVTPCDARVIQFTDLSVGNWTWVRRKNSKYSKPSL